MKRLIFTTILAIACTVSNSMGQSVNETDPMLLLHKEVQSLIDKSPCKIPIEEDYVANVEFTLNDKAEIVVLETDCSNPEIESYIKKTLNYKKVKGGIDPDFLKCVMPIRFRKKK